MKQQLRQWWLRALSLTASGALAVTMTRAEDLRLQVQVEGQWEDVYGLDGENLRIGLNGAKPLGLKHATFRLVGDLAANWTCLQATPGSTISLVARPTESTAPEEWAVVVTPNTGFRWGEKRRAAKDAATWPFQNPARAVLTVAWVAEGAPTALRIRGLLLPGDGESMGSEVQLAVGEGARYGHPVVMAVEAGKVVVPRPEFDEPAANEIAAMIALDRDAAAAALVAGLKKPEAKGRSGATLLHWASRAGASQTLAALLARQPNVNLGDQGKRTPLHWAAAAGQVPAVEMLLQNRASVSAATEGGEQPLHGAVRSGQVAVVEALLAHRAPLDAASEYGPTPLEIALDENRGEIFAMLLARGAQFEWGGGLSLTKPDQRERPAPAGLARRSGAQSDRILFEKAGAGQRPMVAEFLKRGVNPDVDFRGHTSLMAAAREGHAGIVQDLLAAKVGANHANANGATALHLAAGRGHAEIVGLLLKAGCSPTMTTKSGTTPLLSACFAGSAGAVQRLLDAGADPETPDPNGVTPLMLALSSGSPESVASLLSHGAKVDPKAELFGSELEAALTMDSVAFLAAALQAGLRPAAPCRDRWTVEQVARLAGAKRCTEFLQASVGSGPGAADGPRVMPANTWDHPPAVAKMRAVTDPRDPEEWSFNAATVVVDVLIDEKGTPLFPRAVCPDCRLAQAAVRTVAGATFRPALVAGSPVMARARIPIQFLDRANFIFDSAAVDVKPRILKATAPRYPFEMQRRELEGVVVVNFIVDEKGRVRDLYAVRSTNVLFEKPALNALSDWVFSPGIRDGKTVPTRMQMPIAFKIQ